MSTNDRSLPDHVRRDLDRAAAGIGRTPTTAHPDCICGRRIGTKSVSVWLQDDPKVAVEVPVYGRKRDCPQHKTEAKVDRKATG